MPEVDLLDTWVVLNVCHLAFGQQRALMQDGDAVCDPLNELHVVFDDDDGVVCSQSC